MAFSSTTLRQLEKRLPKIISPTTHGIVDYCHAAFFATVAIVCWKKNRRAAYAAAGTSAFVLTEALFTDYKPGVKRVIPFSVHGQLDGGFAALSPAIPWIFGFSGTKAARIFQLNSLVEGTAVGLTNWSDARAQAEEQ